MNYYASLAVAALIPLITGFIWYNPKTFGGVWLKEIGKTEEDMKNGSNMLKVFGCTYLFSFFMAFIWQFLVIHQFGAFGMVGGDIANAHPSFGEFMKDYGQAFRTFKHGALHGTMAGLALSLAIIGINSLFENRSWKYIFIHVGYWTLTGMLMGGFLCQFVNFDGI